MQPENKKLAEQAYTALSQYKGIVQSDVESQIIYNDIVQLAKGNDSADADAILRAVNASIPLRSVYKKLLETLCVAYSPQQAAASTETCALEDIVRETDDLKLSFKRDKTNHAHMYVLLFLTHPTDFQVECGVVVNVVLEDTFYRISFPPVSDHRTQLLFDDQDEKLQALMNRKSEIIIMPR